MAFDLTALRAEVQARGFDYLPTARIDRFINDACHAIDDMEPWSYLIAGTQSNDTSNISDLGRVLAVADVTNGRSLEFRSLAQIINEFGDVTLTGAYPIYYYLSETGVHKFPVAGSVELLVTYIQHTPDLTTGASTPAMPDRFRYAIVEYAVAAALRDVSNYAEAQAAQAAGDAIVARMREWDLLRQGAAGSQTIYGDAGDW